VPRPIPRSRVPGQPPAWWRLLRRHRRLLAAAAAAVAVLVALPSLRAAPAATEPVLVVTRAAAAGSTLGAGDVEVARWPPDLAPGGVLRSPDELPDRPLLSAVAAGEPLVPERFLSPSVLAAYGAGMVATPVRLADAGAAALLREGDVVDVLAARPGDTAAVSTPAQVVASGVRVLLTSVTQPAPDDPFAGTGTGTGDSLVVLATTSTAAAAIAGAAATSRLSVVLRNL
jgi:Flp pilus assembly protein CpaB